MISHLPHGTFRFDVLAVLILFHIITCETNTNTIKVDFLWIVRLIFDILSIFIVNS